MSIVITDIPRIMTALKFDVGALLMSYWFMQPAAEAPPYKYRDDTMVKMDWALGFKRAKDVFDTLVREKIWTNDAARKQIRKMLTRQGLMRSDFVPGQTSGASFAVYNSNQPVIHEKAINFRVVKQGFWDDVDDLAAALANFTFHVQIGGGVEQISQDKAKVTIDTIAVYIRDQYDFIGDQDLGYWDAKKNTVSARNPFAGDKVTNADFRAWRTKNGKGGDFEVFSDVKVLSLGQPDVIEV